MLRLALLLAVALAPAALAQKTPLKPGVDPQAAAPAAPTVASEAPAALGRWTYRIVMPDREPSGTLTVQRATDGFKGTITTDAERRFTSVEVAGTALRATFEQPGFGTVELAATVGVDGALAGTVSAGGGSFPLTATRAD